MSPALYAAQTLKKAEVTIAVNDVRLASPAQPERPAQINDVITGQSVLNTGAKSRAELLFDDKTLARIGANASFSFQEGTRNMELKKGTLLLQVPKDAGGATVKTAAVTAAVTGTTILLEYTPGQAVKAIVLEGTLRLFLPGRPGESILVQPGQMIFMDPKSNQIPDPVDVDLKRLVGSSKLLQMKSPDDGAGGEGNNLNFVIIDHQIDNQQELIQSGAFSETNILIVGEGGEVMLASDELLAAIDQAIAAQDLNPEKYCPAPLITTETSTGNYAITANTQINTDPTITTAGGVTDKGGFYNTSGSSQGSPPVYLFNDNAHSFDITSYFTSDDAANIDLFDIAVFHFSNTVTLEGTPAITIPSNGAHYIAIVSDGNITSGGAYTLDLNDVGLGLITKNGDISLSNTAIDISGSAYGDLYVYARGVGRNLTVGANIEGNETADVELIAENNISITGDLTNIYRLKIHAGSGAITASNSLIEGGDHIEIVGTLTMTGTGWLGAREIDIDGNLTMTDASGDLVSEYVSCNGSITTRKLTVEQLYVDGTLTVGSGGINPHTYADETTAHYLSANAVNVTGYLDYFYGDDATTSSQATGGHILTIDVNSGLTFDNAGGANAIPTNGAINFSGGDALNSTYAQAGDGGSFSVIASGSLNLNRNIEARPGSAYTAGLEGQGGTVSLQSESTLTIMSNIGITVADSTQAGSPPYQGRKSCDGGLISLKSLATSGNGIVIGTAGSSNQLLALTTLAPTTGSKIEFLTEGANIVMNGSGSEVSTGQTTATTLNKILYDTTTSAGNITFAGNAGMPISIVSDVIRMRAGHTLALSYTTLTASEVRLFAGNTLAFNTGVTLNSPMIYLSSPTISFAASPSLSQNCTINVYSSSSVTAGNFTGAGVPTINTLSTAPTFDP